jgi:hypothetical protein
MMDGRGLPMADGGWLIVEGGVLAAVALGVTGANAGLGVSGCGLLTAVAVTMGETGAVAVPVAGAMTAGVMVGGMLTSVGTGEHASRTTRRMKAER